MITKFNIPCVWGGHLAGILLKSKAIESTKKIVGMHGWLDNLNSLLPLAEKLIHRHPNYEIYLFDRAGHGFSNHLPKGSDYSYGYNLRDLRTVTQTLGWNKEKFSLIGHSYGAHLGVTYAAAYPEEISCVVALDSLVGAEKSRKTFWKNVAARIDHDLKYYSKPPKQHKSELTYEKVIELVRSSRIGINDEAAKLLAERSIRLDKDNKLHFTRDDSLKNLSLIPFSQNMAEEAIRSIQASVLFIRAVEQQWPVSKNSVELMKELNPNFEISLIEGSHHLHMTHVDEVVERIEQHFDKYFK